MKYVYLQCQSFYYFLFFFSDSSGEKCRKKITLYVLLLSLFQRHVYWLSNKYLKKKLFCNNCVVHVLIKYIYINFRVHSFRTKSIIYETFLKKNAIIIVINVIKTYVKDARLRVKWCRYTLYTCVYIPTRIRIRTDVTMVANRTRSNVLQV